jgi:hypothetical protein
MSNDIKSGTTHDQSGSGKNDADRTMDSPKTGQQSQGTTPKTDKGMSQQGGSDQKSGQQSQGGANDPKKTSDTMQKSSPSK